jgi:hypothetical protein
MSATALGTRLDNYWDEWKAARPQRGLPLASIKTSHTTYRVSDFVQWARDGSLNLNPNFQRRSVWKTGAKSFLIDTVAKGLPVPLIFVRDLKADLRTLSSKRDIVDGQQRIRTILSYIDPSLVKDYDPSRDEFTISKTHNKVLGGKRFGQLAQEVQQQILDYAFGVQSFPSDTDDRLLLQVFQRMNSTGLKLNKQELRNAEWYGAFKTYAYELATEQLERWRDRWRVFTPDLIARMQEVELTNDFMVLIMDGVLGKSPLKLDDYYRAYDETFQDADEVASRFRNTFDSIDRLFSAEDVPNLLSNRSIFFAVFAIVYGLQYGGIRATAKTHPRLTKLKPRQVRRDVAEHILFRAQTIKDQTAPNTVLKYSRGATAHAVSRRTIIKYLAGEDYDPWLATP